MCSYLTLMNTTFRHPNNYEWKDGSKGSCWNCVSVHTEVPLMLQDTAGCGAPSASQIRTLCWPSALRSLKNCRITGAPATGRNSSDTSE